MTKGSDPPTPNRPDWTPPTGPRTRLILVRHGATAHSAQHRFSGRNDLPLDAIGTAQAADLASRDFGAVDAIVSSPLRRAVQTAQTIATSLGSAVRTLSDLAEVDFGAWEGLTAAEVDRADLDRWRSSVDAAPPGGESFAALGRRVQRARDTIAREYAGRQVLVVSHVTPIKSMVRFALAAPPAALFRLYLDTASVSIIDRAADGSWSVRLVNDTSHLRRS